MHIDEMLAQVEQTTANLQVPKNWSQGRTLYGGLVASMLFQALSAKISPDRVLRNVNTNFIGPVEPEAPFEIETEILRQGKNITVVEARAIQNGRVAAAMMAVFGTARASKIAVENDSTHQMALPKKANFIPQIPGVTPKFLQHLELSVDDGGMPFTKSKKSHYHGWMRFKKSPATITEAHLIALIDGWPPTVLQMTFGPKPASTVSWNLEFLHPRAEIKPGDWLAYQAYTRQAGEGYAHTEANIWDQNGELVAISRQLVAVFD